MEITSTENPTPASGRRDWLRRLAIGVSLAPLAVISVLHSMGRSDDFGVLGEWYVMTPLTVAGVLAWLLVERTVERVVPPAPAAAPAKVAEDARL